MNAEKFIWDNKDELLPEYNLIKSLRRNERFTWDDLVQCAEAYSERLQVDFLKEISEREKLQKDNDSLLNENLSLIRKLNLFRKKLSTRL